MKVRNRLRIKSLNLVCNVSTLSGKTSQKYRPPPVVNMITKHTNGTLNLWSVMFAEKSKFSQLLNIAHNARASGHRFRVNGITCHPVLPLLLTTSHHNIVAGEDGKEAGKTSDQEVRILYLSKNESILMPRFSCRFSVAN